MLQVEFFTKHHCPLCDDAYALLKVLQAEYDFEIIEHDIYTDDRWLEKYQLLIPVIRIHDVEVSGGELDLERLESLLKAQT